MEGHIFSTYITGDESFKIEKGKEKFPIISLLVSGGHTELILIEKWGKYKKIGKTRDDASGEAFDKVARMLGLPYPGGPHISKLAEKERESSSKKNEPLVDVYFPRPMINSKDYDFSFSGLKTSVLYLIRDLEKKDEKILEKRRVKEVIAKEFEDSVVEVLVSKTSKAIKEFGAKKLIVGGGVSANKYLRLKLLEKINTLNNKGEKEEITLHFPSLKHCGDNALMIAIAGFYQSKKTRKSKKIEADGTKAMPC